jgi:hypothetical protein
MKMRRKQRRWLVLTAFGLMAASVLVGQAQAKPDDLMGTAPYSSAGQTPVAGDDGVARVGAENLRAVTQRTHGALGDDELFRGMELPSWWGYETIPAQAQNQIPNVPDGRADSRPFGGGAVAAPVVVDDGSEFSWRDAGFGALGATALLALMATLAIVIRRDRHRGGLATS